MWRSRRRADDAGSHRLAAVEDFKMNPLPRHTPGRERLFHVGHEATRPAQIDVRFSRKANRIEHRLRQMTGGVKIRADLVVRARLAVANIRMTVGERAHETPHFGDERMVLSVA